MPYLISFRPISIGYVTRIVVVPEEIVEIISGTVVV